METDRPLTPDAAGKRRTLPALAPFFDSRAVRAVARRPRPLDLLAGMRIRKKLIVLHTLFSLVLAGVLLVTVRPAARAVLREAEVQQSLALLKLARTDAGFPSDAWRTRLQDTASPDAVRTAARVGDANDLRLSSADAVAAVNAGGDAIPVQASVLGPGAAAFVAGRGSQPDRFVVLSAIVPQAREQVQRLYLFVVGAILGVYVLVALALEVLVLPRNVYLPIRRMLEADSAVQEGRLERELIPAEDIPRDELGEIMRSRNESIVKLRTQGDELARALATLEVVANDLKTKNHLLEAARRNLAEADRLAALGVMSAGIAHELNTPLAVIKGLTERLSASPREGLPAEDVALMLRVVRRLERLSESLLDYARVRPPQVARVRPWSLTQEALTLVSLDRGVHGAQLVNNVDPQLELECDPDRIVQVLVNLVRNAVDALRSGSPPAAPPRGGTVRVESGVRTHEGRRWISLRITDDGPGIDPRVLPRLFEPFVSTRLDSKGTGLGLAVAEGIVGEHGGLLLARNREDGPGAVFEVLLPLDAPALPDTLPNNQP